ncbi:Unconventional myosin-IXb, partial [Eschrichtius robustus]|nr:Unconventional myosin-IXb [Eschrichtius robustus]
KSKGIKQKQIIPKNLLDSKSLKLIISMTLHDRTTKSLLHLHKKKKPPSISAQFQKELCFDDELVLQQLRYTGMLETVRIRRSGYSAKYTFQDFTEQFQVLLPKNAQPCREVISALLEKMDIDKRSYQIGKTKNMPLTRGLPETPSGQWSCLDTGRLRRGWQASSRLGTQDPRETLQGCFSQMVAEKHRAAEKEREAQQAAREETAEAGPGWAAGQEPARGPEPSKDGEHLELEPEVWPSDGSPVESSQPEKAPPAQKNAAESHEKVPSSREKRESRRQRGLEHVQLQNKHIQSCKEEHALREPYRRAVPEPEENLPEDRKEDREDESPRDARTDTGMAPPEKQPEELLQPAPGSPVSPEAQGGSPRPGHVERPTSLALDSRVGVPAPGATPETPKDKSKPGVGPRAQDRPESPGGSTQIQRYRDPDAERLASAVELWRGKKLMTAGPSTMLSQSLDLSERHRAEGVALTPTEERRISLSTSDVSKLLSSPSQTKTQPSAETMDGEPSTKKLAIQKKKSGDASLGTDAGLSPGSVDSKGHLATSADVFGPHELPASGGGGQGCCSAPTINDLRSQKTPIESLFIEATEKFRSNLKTMYSVPNGKIHVGYKDLMENYQIVVSNLAAERGEKDTNLVLNLFQSLLDEFTRGHTKNDFEPPKQSKAQKKKRKQERAVQQHNGHVFASYQVSIPQSCEQCLSYIWLMDKALLCSGTEPGHFGVCVDSLTSDKVSVPVVLEKLLEHVEMHGLYTEGLYRKSGAANRTRELRQALQTDPTAVKLENFPIHAITGVLKQWLRELPEPLMTFAQYGDFLRAVELPEKQEQLAAIYAVLEHLPEANHNSLERLIFHLVKVALLEDVNRMSPSALAIIFAPCLLRCPDNSDPLTSMKDVLKITT